MPNKKTDEPTVRALSEKQAESFIESGIPAIEELVGGIPRGRILELWGAESVGKTHLVTTLMVNLSSNHKILFIDTEFALNKERVEALGVKSKNVDYIADANLERVCELVVQSVGKYDLIILDSLAYLTPLTVDTNEIGETSIGLYARLLKHWIIKLRPRLGVSKTALIATNQYRAPIGLYVRPEPPGGKAWAHAVDVRLYLTTASKDKITKEGRVVGHHINVQVKKSKVSPPHTESKIKVEY